MDQRGQANAVSHSPEGSEADCLMDTEESTWESGASFSLPVASKEDYLKEIADLKRKLEAAEREVSLLKAQLLGQSPETEEDPIIRHVRVPPPPLSHLLTSPSGTESILV
jgi:hypothetical protein